MVQQEAGELEEDAVLEADRFDGDFGRRQVLVEAKDDERGRVVGPEVRGRVKEVLGNGKKVRSSRPAAAAAFGRCW